MPLTWISSRATHRLMNNPGATMPWQRPSASRERERETDTDTDAELRITGYGRGHGSGTLVTGLLGRWNAVASQRPASPEQRGRVRGKLKGCDHAARTPAACL